MIKKVVVGTTPVKIAEGSNPKTLIIYNNSSSIIYLTSDASKPVSEGIPIDAGASYVNDYAKGDYYLLAESSGLDVRVEVN